MPSMVRKPAAACSAGGPGKKQSAEGAHLEETSQNGGGDQKDAATRKRTADQPGEDIVCAKKPSVKSAPGGGGTIRPRKKKVAPQPAPEVDWRVQRIVRDLGRLDVLRRGDVGPDVVSDDEEETALDILVRKLVEDADEEAGHMLPAPADDDHGDDDHYGDIGGGDDDDDDDDDYGDAAMAVDERHWDDDFMPAAQDHYHGNEDANSIAVVTHNGDDSLANMADATSAGEAEVIDLVSAADDEGPSTENTERPSAEDTADVQVPAAAATNSDTEPLLTDVMYNHGARNPLNDPTAKPVYSPGDDDALGRLRSLTRRQIEWFAATSEDVADRKRTAHPVVLGQVGFRCVHCAHTPYKERAKYAVCYPMNYSRIKGAIKQYRSSHFMECKEMPTNIKNFSESLLIRQGKGGKDYIKYLSIRCRNIGIIEEDGRLVYEKSSTSVVDERRDVIGSDGTEKGYWLCDKCQSVKFANFEEARTHEETCHGTAAKPNFSGLDESECLLQRDDTLSRSVSTNQGEGVYGLSLCFECRQVEDPSSDVPMLLCDGCDSATHLTCTKDVPKLIKVPDGEWYCSTCALENKFKEKRLSEDRAVTMAFTAIGNVLEDNFCTALPKLRRRLEDMSVGIIPGIQSKFQPKAPGKRERLCVVVGCTRVGCDMKYRYMCGSHFTRASLLEQIITMPNGERRFPCVSKVKSLPQDHGKAFIAVPSNAKHGTLVKCSHSVCRSLGKKQREFGEKYKYCVVCDNIFSRSSFKDRHSHDHELAVEENEKRMSVDASHQVADAVGAEDDEIVYGFDSIRGHAKDRKRKGEYLFRVKWKNGEITSEPDTFLKEDDPATFVAYLKNSGLAKTKKYAWANEEEHV